MIVVDVEKIGPFVASGGLVNLSENYGADKYAENFAPYAWAQGKGADGDVYGMPVDLGPGVMYYRTDILKSGIDINEAIKDWDSYIAAVKAEATKRSTDRVCCGCGTSDYLYHSARR